MLRAVLLSLALMAAAGVLPAAAGEAPPGQSRLFAATGTVQVELLDGLPPNQYCVPSVVVTIQNSPLSSPFALPVWCRT